MFTHQVNYTIQRPKDPKPLKRYFLAKGCSAPEQAEKQFLESGTHRIFTKQGFEIKIVSVEDSKVFAI